MLYVHLTEKKSVRVEKRKILKNSVSSPILAKTMSKQNKNINIWNLTNRRPDSTRLSKVAFCCILPHFQTLQNKKLL